MRARFLITTAALVVMAVPAFASTPSSDLFGPSANDQTVQPPTGQNNGDIYGDTLVLPFSDHGQKNQGDDMRSMDDRSRNNLVPPRMDASGVPDPRI